MFVVLLYVWSFFDHPFLHTIILNRFDPCHVALCQESDQTSSNWATENGCFSYSYRVTLGYKFFMPMIEAAKIGGPNYKKNRDDFPKWAVKRPVVDWFWKSGVLLGDWSHWIPLDPIGIAPRQVSWCQRTHHCCGTRICWSMLVRPWKRNLVWHFTGGELVMARPCSLLEFPFMLEFDFKTNVVFCWSSPPARWGLLDFMSVACSSPPLLSSSPLLLSSPPLLSCSTATLDAQCSLSDLNHDHPRPVFPAGPQPRPSPPSVPCRTSTMTIPAQCSLPDLNHDHPRPVFPAGPQPRPSTPSVPCRTSTASIHAKCFPCRTSCRKIWDKECAEES